MKNRLVSCVLFLSAVTVGCSFKFAITSQRTALENQVMGSYKEIDDDVVLAASVRGVSSDGAKKKNAATDLQMLALRAKQNQDFNRDDIDEQKTAQILGESSDGLLVVLPSGTGFSSKASANTLEFCRVLSDEENRDREVVWNRIVQSNQNLTIKDMPEVRLTFAKMQFESGSAGHWFQNQKGTWFQKTAVEKSK